MQIVANGLVNGLMIALLALAFAIVYLPTRVFHLALGGVHTVVPYIVWVLVSRQYGWPVAIVVAGASAVVLSGACEQLNHRRLEKSGSSPSIHLVSSLGLYISMAQLAALFWGNDPKTLRTTSDQVTQFAGFFLTTSQIVEAVVAITLLAGAGWFLAFTGLGLQFRGLADNPREMMLRGYNVWRLRRLAFALSGLLCVGSAVPLALDYGFDPNSGLSTLMLAVVAVMVGGRGSFWGPVIGGLTLGLLRSEVIFALSARWQEAATFLVLGLILLFRPAGLCGTLARLEARE